MELKFLVLHVFWQLLTSAWFVALSLGLGALALLMAWAKLFLESFTSTQQTL